VERPSKSPFPCRGASTGTIMNSPAMVRDTRLLAKWPRQRFHSWPRSGPVAVKAKRCTVHLRGVAPEARRHGWLAATSAGAAWSNGGRRSGFRRHAPRDFNAAESCRDAVGLAGLDRCRRSRWMVSDNAQLECLNLVARLLVQSLCNSVDGSMSLTL
jgi:hypothetical protein